MATVLFLGRMSPLHYYFFCDGFGGQNTIGSATEQGAPQDAIDSTSALDVIGNVKVRGLPGDLRLWTGEKVRGLPGDLKLWTAENGK